MKEINEVPHGKTPRHYIDEFCATFECDLTELPPELAEALRVQQKAGKNSKKVSLVGGDNRAEGIFGVLKRMLQCSSHIAVLAAARLWRKPGLDTVLDSVAVYAHANKDCSPEVWYKDTSWLDL